MEVTDGVVRIATPLAGRRNDVYAFVGRHRTVLFDAGVDGVFADHIAPGLDAAGVAAGQVSHAVLSHCDVDHFGGISDAREHLPATTFMAHPSDAGMMQDFRLYLQGRGRSFLKPYGLDEPATELEWVRNVTREGPIDALVCGWERIDLGDRELQLLHVPGHSRGHLAIHDQKRSLVAVSDAVLGDAVPDADGHPIFPPTYRHVAAYLETIERIRALVPEHLVTAHYGTYEGAGVRDFLDTSEEFCRSLGGTVEALFDEAPEGGFTLADCVDRLLPTVGTWPKEGRRNALAFPVCGHLEDLVRAGRLTLEVSGSPAVFRRAA